MNIYKKITQALVLFTFSYLITTPTPIMAMNDFQTPSRQTRKRIDDSATSTPQFLPDNEEIKKQGESESFRRGSQQRLQQSPSWSSFSKSRNLNSSSRNLDDDDDSFVPGEFVQGEDDNSDSDDDSDTGPGRALDGGAAPARAAAATYAPAMRGEDFNNLLTSIKNNDLDMFKELLSNISFSSLSDEQLGLLYEAATVAIGAPSFNSLIDEKWRAESPQDKAQIPKQETQSVRTYSSPQQAYFYSLLRAIDERDTIKFEELLKQKLFSSKKGKEYTLLNEDQRAVLLQRAKRKK